MVRGGVGQADSAVVRHFLFSTLEGAAMIFSRSGGGDGGSMGSGGMVLEFGRFVVPHLPWDKLGRRGADRHDFQRCHAAHHGL